jgi:hypothetical protein
MPKPTQTVPDFLASLPEERQTTVTAIHKAIRKAVPKLAPYVTGGMGTPIIGYGKYRYRSASGREGEWFTIGLAVGKSGYALHICVGGEGGYLVEQNAARLGRVKTGRSCINFKKLEDLNLAEAMKLVKQGAKFGGINAVK